MNIQESTIQISCRVCQCSVTNSRCRQDSLIIIILTTFYDICILNYIYSYNDYHATELNKNWAIYRRAKIFVPLFMLLWIKQQIGKTNKSLFSGAGGENICEKGKHSLSRWRVVDFSHFNEAFNATRSCQYLRTPNQSPVRGEVASLVVCVEAFIIYSLSFHRIYVQDMSFSCFIRAHKKIEFFSLSSSTSIKREKIARCEGSFYFLFSSFFFAGRRRKIVQCRKISELFLVVMCRLLLYVSAPYLHHQHRHAVKVEKLFFNERRSELWHLPTDSVRSSTAGKVHDH